MKNPGRRSATGTSLNLEIKSLANLVISIDVSHYAVNLQCAHGRNFGPFVHRFPFS